MKKHAYLIVANSNFKVVESCLRMIDDPRNDVYLLMDKKTHVSDEQRDRLLHSVVHSGIAFCEEIVNWAGYSQIRAALSLMRLALESGEEYSYLHFMQGSDLPIKTQDEIHRYFSENEGFEFVSIERARTGMAENKAQYRHFFCHNRYFRKSKFVKAMNFGAVKLQKVLGIRKNKDIELYQGSALFSITGVCARFVLSKEVEIYRRFRYSLAADEVFLQSILMASPYRERIKEVEKETSCNARMIDRSRPDGKNSPHVWRLDELRFLLTLPPQYCFARKFDERLDLGIVQALLESIAGKEGEK